MNQLKKYKKEYLAFLLLFIAMLVRHINLSINIGDDTLFRGVFTTQPFSAKALFDFLLFRYQNWTSRILIDGTATIVTHYPFAWKIIDSIVLTAIPFLILILLNVQHNLSAVWAVCAGMMLFPFRILGGAGWITTSLNYTWPFLAGLIGVLPFSRAWQGKIISWKWWLAGLPFLIFGCNNEQVCCFFLGNSILIFIIVYRKYYRIPGILLVEEILMILCLIFVFTCPGNYNRVIEETARWFPEYADLSFFTKFEMGYSSTGYILVMRRNFLFTAFCALLMLNVWVKCKKSFSSLIAALPFVMSMITGMFPEVSGRIFPGVTRMRNQLGDMGTGFNLKDPQTCIPDLYILIVFICVLYGIIVIYQDLDSRIFVIGLLIIGLGTRVMIGFSPTVWASGERTGSFLYFTLLILIVLLVCNFDDSPQKTAEL